MGAPKLIDVAVIVGAILLFLVASQHQEPYPSEVPVKGLRMYPSTISGTGALDMAEDLTPFADLLADAR